MNIKTGLKILGSTSLICVIFIAGLIIPAILIGTAYGIVLGVLLSFVIIACIMNFAYPIWFGDYIEEFWAKEEAKNVEKEK